MEMETMVALCGAGAAPEARRDLEPAEPIGDRPTPRGSCADEIERVGLLAHRHPVAVTFPKQHASVVLI
jgi:hypothetical protein